MKDRTGPVLSHRWLVRPAVVVAVAIVGMFLWMFGGALFFDASFVYRDAAHYYDPLFELTAAEWGAGRIPLWNPYDGIGKPLLADTTSSVLYPGKLIFALPLAFATKYKLYICGHVLLAVGTSFLLARRWGASVSAAAVCGLSYAFSGNVVFQYSNVVFLVGAAWLPLALLVTDRLLRSRSIVWAPVLGCVLALMTFGGDPQAAYHAGLMAAGYAVLLWLRDRRRRRSSNGESPRKTGETPSDDAADVEHDDTESDPFRADTRPALLPRLASHRLLLLAAAAISGGVLAAAQILPAIQWAGGSHRAAYTVPRTLYEVPGFLAGGEAAAADRNALDGLLARPGPGEHLDHAYYFSVGPWRLAEFLWPNVSGRQFPLHRRWIEVIPNETRAWVPTFYMGLLPLLLALGSLRFLRGAVRERWISWSVLLAVLGSFGSYGIGWLVFEVYHAAGGNPETLPFGAPAGGVYWLMTVVLPGYVQFRFPAKLLVVAALGLSLLAARGWDRAWTVASPGLRKIVLCLGGLSLAGIAALLIVRPFWAGWLSGIEPNHLFGPFDAGRAWNDVFFAFLHTAVVSCCVFCLLLPRQTSCQEGPRPSTEWRVSLALMLTAVELAFANGWILPTAPREAWDCPGPLAAAMSVERSGGDNSTLIRADRAAPHPWFLPSWRDVGSVDRQVEGVRFDNVTLMPRFHLRREVGLLDADGSIAPLDYLVFLGQARLGGLPRNGLGRYLHPTIQDIMAADYVILPGDEPQPYTSSKAGVYSRDAENTKSPLAIVWRNNRPHPRAWIADEVVRLDPLTDRRLNALRRRTSEVLFAGAQVRDLRRMVVVEMWPFTDRRVATYSQRAWLDEIDSSNVERCQIVADEPQRVEIDVELALPGLLVLSDYFSPGWEARVRTTTSRSLEIGEPLQIVRTNRVLRGVFLPAGDHKIEFRYCPRPFYVGAAISIVGWLALLSGVLLTWFRWQVRHHGVSTRRVA